MLQVVRDDRATRRGRLVRPDAIDEVLDQLRRLPEIAGWPELLEADKTPCSECRETEPGSPSDE